MIYAVVFLLCSLAAAWAAAVYWHWLLALPVFVLAFGLMHLLWLTTFWLLALPVDRSKPIEKQRASSREACRSVGRFLCLYAGAKPHFSGVEKLPADSRFLFVCNHQAGFDPLLVMGYLNRFNISFVAKLSLMALPMVGDIAWSAGFLGIDRENDRAALKTILTAVDYLKRDLCSVGIYPEGTRSRSGELLPFRSGSCKIAQRAKVPVAVACVRDTEKAVKGLFLRPRRCSLDILEVLPAERVCAMNTHELADCCRALMEKHLKEAGKA